MENGKLSEFVSACKGKAELCSRWDAVVLSALHLTRSECDCAIQLRTTGEVSPDQRRELNRNEEAFVKTKQSLHEEAERIHISIPERYSEDDVFRLLT